MAERIRMLRDNVSFPPKPARYEGLNGMTMGEHFVQFPSDGDAAFFIAAYDIVPALLDEVAGMHKRLEQLEDSRVAQLERDLENWKSAAACSAIDKHDLERRLEHEVAERTKAERRVRVLSRALLKQHVK